MKPTEPIKKNYDKKDIEFVKAIIENGKKLDIQAQKSESSKNQKQHETPGK